MQTDHSSGMPAARNESPSSCATGLARMEADDEDESEDEDFEGGGAEDEDDDDDDSGSSDAEEVCHTLHTRRCELRWSLW